MVDLLSEVHAGVPLHEMSLPTDRLRADLVSVREQHLIGYELKSCADRLDRLARQAVAYEEVFAYCHVVAGHRHLKAVREILPPWWGIWAVARDGSRLYVARKARRHGNVRPDVLVKLLWRDESAHELRRLGFSPDGRTPRSELWQKLVEELAVSELQRVVAAALSSRRAIDARIDTRWSRTA